MGQGLRKSARNKAAPEGGVEAARDCCTWAERGKEEAVSGTQVGLLKGKDYQREGNS